MELGEFLTELRREKGLLQKEVADYLKVTVATISNYEKGVHSPDLDTLVKLADFFDVSVDYLLHRTTCKTGISALNRPIAADYTVGDLLNITLELDRHSLESLVDYYELLRMRNNARSHGS